MTPEELNEVARFWTEFRSDSPEAQVIAGLQSALRASQAAVVQMREDAARVADIARGGVLSAGGFATADRIAKAIRALPAPAVRTYEDVRREGVQAAFDAVHRVSALPYMDSPRSAFDAARIMREACQDAVQALLSPAPAVAPVAAPKPGPEIVAVSSFTPPFDAEAALMEMALKLNESISAGHHPVTCDDMLTAIEAGLAAGRGARS